MNCMEMKYNLWTEQYVIAIILGFMVKGLIVPFDGRVYVCVRGL